VPVGVIDQRVPLGVTDQRVPLGVTPATWAEAAGTDDPPSATTEPEGPAGKAGAANAAETSPGPTSRLDPAVMTMTKHRRIDPMQAHRPAAITTLSGQRVI
jgi:hypothetical protein